MHPIVLILSLINILFAYLVYNDLANEFGLISISYLQMVSIYCFMVLVYFLITSPYTDIQTILAMNKKEKMYFAIAKTDTITIFTLFYYLMRLV